jgi:hypothetical protein
MIRPCRSTSSSTLTPCLRCLLEYQVAAVTPVGGGDKGVVDQADSAGDQRGQLRLVAGAECVGEEGDHRLVVVPGGGRADPEVLVQVLVGGVAPQPAQRQP